MEERAFDYYTTFDEDGLGVSGEDRWGDLPTVAKADSEDGQELIQRAMDGMKKNFERNVEKIKKAVNNYEPEELMDCLSIEDDDVSMFRHYCYKIGQYRGFEVRLYDQVGEGIRNERHLENVLNKWPEVSDEGKYEDEEIYVVPADVHF